MISFKGRHHQQDIILQCVRWYVAYSLSYRDLEELMQERGYTVDHSTVQRWVVHYGPRIEKAFRKNKRQTGLRWRLDETYIKIKGEWKYLYRAVDKQGKTVDFLLTARRDKRAARRFLNKAIGSHGKPPTQTGSLLVCTKCFFDARPVMHDPALNGAMIHRVASFLHQLLQVPIAQRICHVPAHAL